MQAQTAQAASHGRFTLGVGLSIKSFVEQTYGLAPHPRVRHLREYLDVLHTLFETGEANLSGKTLVAKTSLPGKVPGAQPRVPVLVAAAGKQTLPAAGELADGALPILSGPEPSPSTPCRPSPVRAGGRAAGAQGRRDRLRRGDRQRGGGPSPRRAEHGVLRTIPSYRAALDREGVDHPADLVAIGDEKLLADQVSAYFEAGVTELVYTQTAIGSAEDERRTWKLLGELAARYRHDPAGTEGTSSTESRPP